MVVVVIGLVFLALKGRDIISRRTVKKYTAIITLLVIVVVVNPMLLKNTSFYQHRLTSRTDEGRIETYIAASRMFLNNPIIGIGLKDFKDDMLKYVDVEAEAIRWSAGGHSSCHNSFLVVAAECGLMGLIPLLLFFYFAYETCRKYYGLAKERTEKSWALIMGALTIGYFLSAMTFDPFFEPTIDNKLFYMCLGITIGRYNRLKCSL